MFRFLLLLTALALVGCSYADSEKIKVGFDKNVYDFELSDGTRCVVFDGPLGAGSITCDWASND